MAGEESVDADGAPDGDAESFAALAFSRLVQAAAAATRSAIEPNAAGVHTSHSSREVVSAERLAITVPSRGGVVRERLERSAQSGVTDDRLWSV